MGIASLEARSRILAVNGHAIQHQGLESCDFPSLGEKISSELIFRISEGVRRTGDNGGWSSQESWVLFSISDISNFWVHLGDPILQSVISVTFFYSFSFLISVIYYFNIQCQLRLLIDYSMKSLPNNHIEVKGIPISKQDAQNWTSS